MLAFSMDLKYFVRPSLNQSDSVITRAIGLETDGLK